jgi:hypothetical protein
MFIMIFMQLIQRFEAAVQLSGATAREVRRRARVGIEPSLGQITGLSIRDLRETPSTQAHRFPIRSRNRPAFRRAPLVLCF